jgi:hypothetical protein
MRGDEKTSGPDAAPAVPARARPLTDGERAAVAGVAALVFVLGLIGFANSFARVAAAAEPSFGPLAPTVPLGIDLGIAAFCALDIVLARLDMRRRWVRLIPWALTAATIYLNVAGQPSWFARVAHGVFPALWVAAVEIGAHVVRVRAGLEAGTAMDRIRASRWLLAPSRTAGLWRRMVLWEIRSYPLALARERDRLLALTGLQDAYGPLSWRWRAPRRVRALYRLGELTPARDDTPPTRPAEPGRLAGPAAVPAAPAVPAARRRAPRKARRAAAPDVDALMPLGWQVTADLADRGEALTRDTLAAGLRAAGHAAGNARVGALLARLKTGAPADPADTPAPDHVPALADGGNQR